MTNQGHSENQSPTVGPSGTEPTGALEMLVHGYELYAKALVQLYHLRKSDPESFRRIGAALDGAARMHREVRFHVDAARRELEAAQQAGLALSDRLQFIQQLLTKSD